MEAVILAGGFGTRLSHIVASVPKPMAPVNNKPFLVYILDYLAKYNFERVVLAVGYKSDVIKQYFGSTYHNLEIIYSDEDTPLGTGGAIKKALSLCKDSDVYIFNGDTYFDVDLEALNAIHLKTNSDITVAIKQMFNYDRYGSIILGPNDRISKFSEKMYTEIGYINGGVYLISKNLLSPIALDTFSFETMILESNEYTISAYKSNGYFIDIGIPEDYSKAQEDFKDER